MIPTEQIMRILPHRFPLLLVDRVLEMVPRKTIVAIKNVTCNEQFFQGHFPDWKIMPGVLILEAMAQAGAVLLFSSIPDPGTKVVVLSKVDKAKFKRMVVPGDQLRMQVAWTREKARVCQMKGQAFVGDELAAEAEIYATILDVAEVRSTLT